MWAPHPPTCLSAPTPTPPPLLSPWAGGRHGMGVCLIGAVCGPLRGRDRRAPLSPKTRRWVLGEELGTRRRLGGPLQSLPFEDLPSSSPCRWDSSGALGTLEGEGLGVGPGCDPSCCPTCAFCLQSPSAQLSEPSHQWPSGPRASQGSCTHSPMAMVPGREGGRV